MVWCSYCATDQETENDDINGFTCCTGCGRVLDDNIYSSDPTFTKTADGQSQVQGNFIRDSQYNSGRFESSGFRYSSGSHEKTLEKGRNEIKDIADFLAMGGRDDTVGAAHRLYTLAIERNFTRGRRTNQVAAACLYIVCRQDQKPFLLIDFSDCLQTNVYVLGAVFLQLCRLLRLEQHPIMQKPVDPSLFIHRFTDRLVGRTTGHGKKFHAIANTALRLVASMKRDWMQTGRRPSGICGAALFLSAHIHGFDCTKADVVSVVHICEATLKKRLIEFENTESGSLTAEEFEARAKELEAQHASIPETPLASSQVESVKGLREVLCEHKDIGATHFAFGLCNSCYEEFVKISGGLQGGAAPPAFQRAEKKRMEAVRLQMCEQGLLSNEEGKTKVCGGRQGRSVVSKGIEEGTQGRRGRGRGRRRGSLGVDKRENQGLVEERKVRGGKGRGRGRRRSFEDQDTINLASQDVGEQVTERENISEHVGNVAEQGLEAALLKEEQVAMDINSRLVENIEAASCLNKAADNDKSNEMPESSFRSSSTQQQPVEMVDVISLSTIHQSVEKDVAASSTYTLTQQFAVKNKNGVDGEGCKEVGAEVLQNNVNTMDAKAGKEARERQSCGSVDNHGTSDASISETPKGGKEGGDFVSDSMHHEPYKSFDLHADDGETLSDIDDNEVEVYLHNEEEVRLKTIIWTEMNKDYLEEQQAKEEALAASQAAQAAALAAAAENSASAVELAAAAAAAVAELRKDRKRKKLEAKNKPPPESAAEATRQMLQSKRLSSKVNYSALEKLFDGEGGTKTEIGDDNEPNVSTDRTGKHIKWADDIASASLPQSQNGTEFCAKSENAAVKDDMLEEDGDFMDEDEILGAQEEQIPSYHLPYEQADDDDEYYGY